MRYGAILALAAVLAAGCGAPAGAHATSRNVAACRHFNAQGERYAANATPTLADVAQVIGWVRNDEILATDPALRRAFARWVAGANLLLEGRKLAANPKKAVAAACAPYGVKV